MFSVCFSPNGKQVLTGMPTKPHASGMPSWKELCRLIGFKDGTWAVMDNAGRYDSFHSLCDIEGLHWVVGLEAIPLSRSSSDAHHTSGPAR